MNKRVCGFWGGHHYQPGPALYAFGLFADKYHPRMYTGDMYEQTCSRCGDCIFTVPGSRRIIPESVQRIPRPTPLRAPAYRAPHVVAPANLYPRHDDSGAGLGTGLLLGSLLNADHAHATPSSDPPAFEPGGGTTGGGGAGGSYDSGASSSSDSGSSSSDSGGSSDSGLGGASC